MITLKSDKLRKLIHNKSNKVIYDKKKDFSQVTSGITVPSVLNDPSFFIDSIHQNKPVVNTSAKKHSLAAKESQTNAKEVVFGKSGEAQHKAMIDSEVVAELVGQALNSDKFLSRYAHIGKVQLLLIKPNRYKYINMKELFAKALDNFV